LPVVHLKVVRGGFVVVASGRSGFATSVLISGLRITLGIFDCMILNVNMSCCARVHNFTPQLRTVVHGRRVVANLQGACNFDNSFK
jgi:hypothetical protein